MTQEEKGKVFRALHERDGAFIIPNPWDIGTARLLAHLGFEALATTSAGYAFSVGQRDNTIGRDRMMAHVAEIVSARSEEHTSELQSRLHLVCRLLLEKKKKKKNIDIRQILSHD